MNNTSSCNDSNYINTTLSVYVPIGFFIVSEVLALIPPNNKYNGVIQSGIIFLKNVIQRLQNTPISKS